MPLTRDHAIGIGFALFKATRLHRLLRPWTQGRGAILMLHHVRPARQRDFAPNRLLEITPEFLDAALTAVKAAGFDLVTMDEALARLARRAAAPREKPFAVLTFDDGYRDNRDFALPVLERHKAPFTLYCAGGFADRGARLWWLELEAAVAALPHVWVATPQGEARFPAGDAAEKTAAFAKIYWLLRGQGEDSLLRETRRLADEAGVDGRALVARECLDWDEIAALSRHPLCTIGAHTMTHPRLAKLPPQQARAEMAASRSQIESRIGKPVRHFSYPIGDPTSAGEREFVFARELGFSSAVTTRPGMVLPQHAQRLHALPRLSVNGKWQSVAALEVLLSGAPFALLNRMRPA